MIARIWLIKSRFIPNGPSKKYVLSVYYSVRKPYLQTINSAKIHLVFKRSDWLSVQIHKSSLYIVSTLSDRVCQPRKV